MRSRWIRGFAKGCGFYRASLVCLLVPAVAFAETNVWVGGGGNVSWSTPGNWTNGLVPVGASDLVVQLAGNLNMGTSVTSLIQDIANPLELNRLETLDVAGSGDVQVYVGGGGLSFVTNGTVQPTLKHNRENSLYVRAPVILPSGVTLAINNRTFGIDIEGVVSGEGGFSFGSGAQGGEMSLKNPSNSFSGGTAYINTSGANAQYTRLYVSVSNALGTGPVTLSGGNLNVLGSANMQAGGLTFRGTSAHTNAFSLLASSPVFAGDGITNATVAAANVTLSGPFNLNTNTLYLRGQGNTAGTLSGVISQGGASAVTKMDLGLWTLSGANTFTGRLTVGNGTLKMGAADALNQWAPVTVSGGAYDLNGFTVTNGAVTVSAGEINNGTLNASSVMATDSGIIRAILSGSGGLTKSGAGTLVLVVTNRYSGVTTVNGGILQFVKRNALYDGDTSQWTDSNIIVNSGATMAFNVGRVFEFTDSDIGVLAGIGSASGGFKSGSFLGLDTTNAEGGVFACSSVLGNPAGNMLGLQKLGLGTLTLGSANTYTGATKITSGELSVSLLANGGTASGIGSSSNAAAKLIFDGGTLRYTGPTASTDRRFTISAGKNAVFDVVQPGATLTFAAIKGSVVPGGTIITKNGPGTLTFGLDGKTTDANWGYISGIDCFVLNEGSYLNVANDTPQINVSRQAGSGPALILGDGAYLGCSIPMDVLGSNTEQIVRYIGTSATATITAGLFSGPGMGGSNTKTFDVNDGAAEIDLLVSANYGIYSATNLPAVSDIRKTGAGTLKLSGADSQYKGTMTVRNGRLVVGGNVPVGGNSVLGNATSVVQVADSGTAVSNHVSLVFDGPYTFSRGICVNPYGASATIGNVSTSRAVFAGAVLLSNTVQFVSSTAGTNVTLVSAVISGPGGITKTGTGTVVLASSNTYTGLTSVAAGALRLGASDCIADASGLRLTGGTFDTAGYSETMGSLDVDGNAVIDFGNAASVLRFAASGAQTWDGTLTLLNWTRSSYGVGVDRLYVGDSAGGLTQAQLAKIVLPRGQKAQQLATGEVIPIPAETLFMVK